MSIGGVSGTKSRRVFIVRAARSRYHGAGIDQVRAHRGACHQQPALADVESIVTTIFDHITAALARGGRVELRGFGVFTVKRRNARLGHNPRTREPVSVNEKTKPFFKAGKELRGRLNHGGNAEP